MDIGSKCGGRGIKEKEERSRLEQKIGRREREGKRVKNLTFWPNYHFALRERSIFDLKIGRNFGRRDRPFPATFWGMSKNKSDSKWGVLPRIGVWSLGSEIFWQPIIALDTQICPRLWNLKRSPDWPSEIVDPTGPRIGWSDDLSISKTSGIRGQTEPRKDLQEVQLARTSSYRSALESTTGPFLASAPPSNIEFCGKSLKPCKLLENALISNFSGKPELETIVEK
ncbi:hypothetical protein Prudu_012938, partial [Prunus dulcis]